MGIKTTTVDVDWQTALTHFPAAILVFDPDRVWVLSERGRQVLRLPEGCDAYSHWSPPLKEFLMVLEGPELQRGEVTIPWPDDPRTLGYTLTKLDWPGMPSDVKVCLFSDITVVIKDRLRLEQLKESAFDRDSHITRHMLTTSTISDIENALTSLFLQQAVLEREAAEATPDGSIPSDREGIPLQTRVLSTLEGLQQTCSHLAVLLNQVRIINDQHPTLVFEPIDLHHLLQTLSQQLKRLPRFELIPLQLDTKQGKGKKIILDKLSLEQLVYQLALNKGNAAGQPISIKVFQETPAMLTLELSPIRPTANMESPDLASQDPGWLLCLSLIRQLGGRLDSIPLPDGCQTLRLSWPIL